jgi:hypothetical protein
MWITPCWGLRLSSSYFTRGLEMRFGNISSNIVDPQGFQSFLGRDTLVFSPAAQLPVRRQVLVEQFVRIPIISRLARQGAIGGGIEEPAVRDQLRPGRRS